jgi:hypothetical protein
MVRGNTLSRKSVLLKRAGMKNNMTSARVLCFSLVFSCQKVKATLRIIDFKHFQKIKSNKRIWEVEESYHLKNGCSEGSIGLVG